jgi:hypothetical protein
LASREKGNKQVPRKDYMRKAIIAVDSAFARAVLANVQNTAGRPPTVINPKAVATGAKTGAINSITISESFWT